MTASPEPDAPLHVALLAPPWYQVPPAAYGGIESVVADLANQLVGQGHRVTLIGHAGEGLTAEVVGTYDEPQGDRIGDSAVEVAHAAAAQNMIAQLTPDVVHDHSLAGPLLAASRPCPTVVTMHGPPTPDIAMMFHALRSDVGLVAISDSQREQAPQLPWLSTVYNAVEVDQYPFRPQKDDFFLFLGRCTPDKGVHLAVQAARDAGRPLVLAMKCSEPHEQEYFDAEVKPLLGPDTDFVGEVGGERKLDLLARARALLFPIQWDEPFGMVAIEAMACGTPVVGSRRGALPETVVQGLTGVLVDDPAELPAALHAVEEIDPRTCREHVAQRFSGEAMAHGYAHAYRLALAGAR